MKKLTKKYIKEVIKTGTLNDVLRLASLKGYDLSDSLLGLDKFLRDYDTTEKRTLRLKSDLVIIQFVRVLREENIRPQKITHLKSVIDGLKKYKGDTSNYRKRLFDSPDGIFWCNPNFGLSDYNSSFALPLSERNYKVMKLVNSVLDRHYELNLV